MRNFFRTLILTIASNLALNSSLADQQTIAPAQRLVDISGTNLMYTAHTIDETFLTETNLVGYATEEYVDEQDNAVKDWVKEQIFTNSNLIVIGAATAEEDDETFDHVQTLKFDKETGFSVIQDTNGIINIKMNSAWTELIPDLHGQELSSNYSGEWNPDDGWDVGEIVLYDSEYWICIESDDSGIPPNESDKWKELGNLRPSGEEKLSIKVVETDTPGTYWDYNNTNKNEKTFNIGISSGTRLEIHLNTEIPSYEYDIENVKNNHFFKFDEYEDDGEVKIIRLPVANTEKNESMMVYLEELPAIGSFYDISENNIHEKSYPSGKPWMNDEDSDGIWTMNFSSLPGCDDWNLSYTKKDKPFYEWIVDDYGMIIGFRGTAIGKLKIPSEVRGIEVVNISDEVLTNQTKMTSVVIPDSVTVIGDRTFAGCTNLLEVEIGKSLGDISADAFEDCPIDTVYYTRLEDESHDDANDRVRNLFGDVLDVEDEDLYFCDITPLECIFEITQNGTITGYEIESETPGCMTIPSEIDGIEVVAIDGGVISWNEDITKVILPNTLIQISDDNFNGLSIRTFEIPNGVEEIEGYILADNEYLKRISIPSSVNEIGDDFGYNSGKLNTIKVSKNNQEFTDENGVLFTKDMTLLKVYPIGKTNETYEIPNGVETVGYDAFCYAYNLTNVYIPNSVIKLDNYAFTESELKEVYIPDSVVDFGDYENDTYTFGYCHNLEKVRLPQNMTYIPCGMFDGCESLSDIEIPDGVEIIYGAAFSGCSDLTSVAIPNNITSIGDSVFYNCTGLTSITIPDNVTSIGNWAFYNCDGLTSCVIGNGVTNIGGRAFSSCTSLSSITIGNGLISIGISTFWNCNNLTEIKYICSSGQEQTRKQEIIDMLTSSGFNTSQITTWNVVSSE